MMKRKLNKKSLYQEGGAMQASDSRPKQMVAVNIASQLEDGVSPVSIYKDLISQFVPTDEIHSAFKELGYPLQTIEQLSEQVSLIMEKDSADKSIQEGAIKKAQRGSGFFPRNISGANKSITGYRPAQDWYLPENLGNRGNVLGALATFGEATASLFSGKEGDDGLKKGALRDVREKRARHKDKKGEYFSYDVKFDPNDPNIDQKTGKNLNYALNISDLYKGVVDTVPEYMERLDEYSRINVDPETGKYTGILSADKINPKLYDKEDISTLKDSVSLGDFRKIMKASPDQRRLIAQQLGLSGDKMPEGTTYGVDPSGIAAAYASPGDNPYLRETMLGQNIYGDTSLLQPASPSQSLNLTQIPEMAQFPVAASRAPFAPRQVQNADQISFKEWYAKNAASLGGKSEMELRDMFVDEQLNKRYGGSIYTNDEAKKGGESETLDEIIGKIKDPIFKQAFAAVLSGPTPVGDPAVLSSDDIPKAQTGVPGSGMGSMYLQNLQAQQNIMGLPDEQDVDDSLFASPKVKRRNKLMGSINYALDSPAADIAGKLGAFGVAGAGVLNEAFDAREAAQVEKDLRTKDFLADAVYGTYEEMEGDRGMWDINTGLAQPDNLVVGYAQKGGGIDNPGFRALPPEVQENIRTNMKKGGEFKPHIMYDPETGEGYMAEKMEDHLRMKEMGYLHKEEMKEKKQQGGEVMDLDMETITALIAAGADIEII